MGRPFSLFRIFFSICTRGAAERAHTASVISRRQRVIDGRTEWRAYMSSHEGQRGHAEPVYGRRFTPWLMAVAVGYFVAHLLAFPFLDPAALTEAFFPPAAIGLTAFLLTERRRWPAIGAALLAAGAAAYVIDGRAFTIAIGYPASNLLESLLGAVIVIGMTRGDVRCDTVRGVAAMTIASLVASTVASLPAAALAVFAGAPSFVVAWRMGAVEDANSILLFAPLLIALVKAPPSVRPVRVAAAAEYTLFIILWFVLARWSLEPSTSLVAPRPFWLALFGAVAAMRYAERGIAFAGASLLVMVVTSPAVRHGPIAWGLLDDTGRLLASQMFTWSVVAGMMLLMAVRLEAQRSARRLEVSEGFLRTVIDQSPHPMWIADAHGTLVRVNDACLAQMAWTREQVVGRYNILEDAAVLRNECRQTLRSVFSTGTPARIEIRIPSPHGSADARGEPTSLILDVSAAPICDAGGRVTEVVFQYTDVTLIRQKVAELITATGQLNMAQRVAHLGSFTTNVQTGKTLATDELYRIIGWSPDVHGELTEEVWVSLAHPDERERVEAARLRLRDEGVFRPGILRIARADGLTRHVYIEVADCERDAAGRPLIVQGIMQDLTPFVEAQEKLADSESRFRATFENAGLVMMLIRDKDGLLVDVNDYAVQFYGYRREEMIGRTLAEIGILPTESFGRERADTSKRDGAGHWLSEHRLQNGMTRQMDVSLTFFLVRGEGMHFAIAYDATEREDAKQALIESEARFRAVFENAGQVMFLIRHHDGVLLDTNDAAARFYGYTRGEMIGRSLADLGILPSEEFGLNYRQRNKREGVSNWTVSHRIRGGGARQMDVSMTYFHLRNSEVHLAIAYDATEREEARKALEVSERKYAAMFEYGPVGAFVTDEEGRVIEANKALQRIAGWSRDELLARRTDDPQWSVLRDDGSRMPPEELASRRALREKRPVQNHTMGMLQADGSVRWLLVNALPLDIPGFGVLVQFTDITEKRTVTQALRALNATLESRVAEEVARNLENERRMAGQARLAAMGEMIGAIAHQWRQPLSALGMVWNNVEDLYKRGELTPEGFADALSQGRRLTEKMSTTIGDFRDFLRPQKERSAFSARHQVETALRLLAPSFNAQNVLVEIEGTGDFSVRGVGNEYSQVLLNLLDNARDAMLATSAAGGTIRVRLSVRGTTGRLTVTDEGPGIPPEMLDKIFDPYFTTKESGTGLGLYMARAIMQRSMGGTVEARNVPGGAEFCIVTPLENET